MSKQYYIGNNTPDLYVAVGNEKVVCLDREGQRRTGSIWGPTTMAGLSITPVNSIAEYLGYFEDGAEVPYSEGVLHMLFDHNPCEDMVGTLLVDRLKAAYGGVVAKPTATSVKQITPGYTPTNHTECAFKF